MTEAGDDGAEGDGRERLSSVVLNVNGADWRRSGKAIADPLG
jgi:hypothetical protein